MRLPARTFTLLFLLILILGVSLRAWGINFGLPYLYHPDEPNKIVMAQQMFKTGDLNPHYFLKPSLFIYLNALAYLPYYGLGKLLGLFDSRSDIVPPAMLAMGVGQTLAPGTVLLGRWLTLVFGAASIILVYLIGSRASQARLAGLMAALMMTISPTNVSNSRYITPDAYVTFFILLAVWASVRIYQEGKPLDYVLAGVAAGLAVSSKYTGGLVLLAIVAAHFLRAGRAGLKQPLLYLSLLLCPAAFLLTSPFVVLDFQKFLQDMLFEARHYSSSGHAGMEGNSFKWYVSYFWRYEGPLFLLAVGGILRGIYLRRREILIVSIFPVIYFAFVSLMLVRNDRTLLPAIPFTFVLASYLLVGLFDWSRSPGRSPLKVLSGAAMAIVLALCLLVPLRTTVDVAQRLTAADGREAARAWIAANLPKGTKVAIESYAPFVDPGLYQVQTYTRIIDQTPDWYVTNGFKYLVFSQGMFGRFYEEPQLYADQVSQYDGFFSRFPLVQRFTDGGYEVRLYAVPD